MMSKEELESAPDLLPRNDQSLGDVLHKAFGGWCDPKKEKFRNENRHGPSSVIHPLSSVQDRDDTSDSELSTSGLIEVRDLNNDDLSTHASMQETTNTTIIAKDATSTTEKRLNKFKVTLLDLIVLILSVAVLCKFNITREYWVVTKTSAQGSFSWIRQQDNVTEAALEFLKWIQPRQATSVADVNGLDFPTTINHHGTTLELVGGGAFGNVKAYSVAVYMSAGGRTKVQNEFQKITKKKLLRGSHIMETLFDTYSIPNGLVLQFHFKAKPNGVVSAMVQQVKRHLDNNKSVVNEFSTALHSVFPTKTIRSGMEFLFVCDKRNTQMTMSSDQGVFSIRDPTICKAFFNTYLGPMANTRAIKHGFVRSMLVSDQ